jgi:catechol 2,3-dioxygenase-like lactoylglutathione lyase family enzyme
MPQFRKLTPNLLVADVSRSLTFYTDVLGFTRGMSVPEAEPFVFASVTSGTVEIFFNEARAALEEYPALGGRPLGATATMFIEVEQIEKLCAAIESKVQILVPLHTQWYGVKEFVIADPDGYLITFAEPVEQQV